MSTLTAEAIFNPFMELETVDVYDTRDLNTAEVYYLGDMNPYDSGSSLYVRQRSEPRVVEHMVTSLRPRTRGTAPEHLAGRVRHR